VFTGNLVQVARVKKQLVSQLGDRNPVL
jgi:hypothetical protein